VFVKDLLERLCNLLGVTTNGILDIVYSIFLDKIKTVVINPDGKDYYKSVFDYLEIFIFGASVFPSYSRDLKLFSLITIAIGALQIIIASVALKNQFNE